MPGALMQMPVKYGDVNAVVGGLLRDLAFAQTSPQRTFGYKRAAAVVLSLEQPLTDLVRADRTLPKISGIGPGINPRDSGSARHRFVADGRAQRCSQRPSRRHRAAPRASRDFLSRAEVLRVLRDPAFDGPVARGLSGDLQMHSEWSDGAPTLRRDCRRVYRARLPLRRGHGSFAWPEDRRRNVDGGGGRSASRDRQPECRVRARFRLMRGIEANIGGDGQLDLSADEAAQFELVLAAPHSRLRKTEDQTERLLTAIQNPAVHVLAHPRGRISGSRAGVVADWETVFACRSRGGRRHRDRRRSRPARTSTTRWPRARSRPAAYSHSTAMPTPPNSFAMRRRRSRTRGLQHPARSHRELLVARSTDRVVVRSKLSERRPIEPGRKVATVIGVKVTPTERNEMDEHLTGEAAIAKARQLLPGFRTAMLVTRAPGGATLHMRPMGLQGDLSVFGGTLWFFTDDRSPKVQEIERDPTVSLVFQSDETSRYLQLDGTASIVSDRGKMRELFTPIARTWFPDGVDDPHLTLLRIDVTAGAFWESPGGMLQVLAAFTKSVVTGAPGKGGRAGTIDL